LKEKILKTVRENNIKFIRLQFTDIFGMLKNVVITKSQLSKALNNECMFDGSSIEGFVRIEESDMYLYPDLNTFAILPWQPNGGKIARLICDVYTPDKKPFEGDPRYVLKKALKEAEKMGYTFNAGPECEFFLFHTDEKGRSTTVTHDEAGYFDLGPVDLGENARREMCLMLEEMGFEVEASHHEVAQGQHEIDFKYGDALEMADKIMTFKLIVKTIAQRHGLHATFMPKPIFGIAGSGMHINMSLTQNGENAFYDNNDINSLSPIAYNFIAGILKHIKGMVAITNPLVNSYKRFVPGFEAPIYIAWSARNRSPLIRVPTACGEGARVELRCPDPSANPYLALAVCISAGLDGIKNNLKCCDGIDENIYNMTKQDRKKASIETLPTTLEDAIYELEQSSLIREVLGEHVFKNFIDAKKKEWSDYTIRITEWELDNYLNKY